MTSHGARRELLVTLSATPASGPAQRHGPERQRLADAGILDQDTGWWDAYFGVLDEEALRRLDPHSAADRRPVPRRWPHPPLVAVCRTTRGTHPEVNGTCRVLREIVEEGDPFERFSGASAQVTVTHDHSVELR